MPGISRITMRFALLMLLLASFAGAAAQPPTLDEVRRLVREVRLDEALTAIDARLAVDPSDRQARFLKGVVHAERQEDVQAIEVFTALARDYPTLPEPHNNLAVLHASRGDYEAARDALLKAINTHPSYATAHENLGDIYAKMAGLAYTRALSLDTANAAAKDKLALIDDLFTRGGTAPATMVATASPPMPVAEPATPNPAVPAARSVVTAAVPAVATVAPPAPAVVADLEAREVQTAAIETLESWAEAWTAQDVDRYLGYYVAGVSPEPGIGRKRWENTRRIRLTKPEFIEVDVDSFQVRSSGENEAEVTFIQSYRSNTYADRVRKRVSLKRTPGGWKISEERTLAKL